MIQTFVAISGLLVPGMVGAVRIDPLGDFCHNGLWKTLSVFLILVMGSCWTWSLAPISKDMESSCELRCAQ